MPRPIPLIRAAALVPMLRWMHDNGRPVERLLAEADLSYVSPDFPDLPIPVLSVAAFFRNACQAEGPDIGCRVVSETTVLELAMIGKVALGARTPREAIARVAAALPYHCSVEQIVIHADAKGLTLQEGLSIRLDSETLHVAQQFIASTIAVLLGMSGAAPPLVERIEMVPHPVSGLDHLLPWLGPVVVPAKSRALTIRVASRVADAPFHRVARDRMAVMSFSGLVPMSADGTLAGSARMLMAGMLLSETPTIQQLAAAAGQSVRTFQRRLLDEGTAFSLLLDDVRHDSALKEIAARQVTLSSLSASLGYSRQAALTRAVRRWTGRTPTELRSARRN